MAIMSGSGARSASRKMPVDLERREACRFHTVMRVARVTRAHDAGIWRIRNISDGGMMLLAAVPVAPGERLSIALSESVNVDGRVAWWDGARCGVAFDAPIDCAAVLGQLVTEQKAPRYRPLRLPVSTRAVAFCEQGLHAVRIHDISQHGAGFTHDGCFKAGMITRLSFANGDEHRGVIRWSDGGRAGIYLIEPISCARLESAARL
jgi:hypothetical protein